MTIGLAISAGVPGCSPEAAGSAVGRRGEVEWASDESDVFGLGGGVGCESLWVHDARAHSYITFGMSSTPPECEGISPELEPKKRSRPPFRHQAQPKVADPLPMGAGLGENSMGTTKLRGFEWAGLRLALEAPAEWVWDWPAAFAQRICHPEDPDVYVSVHPLREYRSLEHVRSYSHEGSLFETGSIDGEDHLVVTEDRRLARFDSEIRRCDVWLPPSAIRSRVFPLASPLDDLILIHRALVRGALTVRATAAVRQGRALVVLGDSCLADPKPGTAMWEGWLLLEARGDGIWVQPLPSTRQTGPTVRAGALLEGLHVVDSDANDDSLTRTLGSELAAGEILRFAFAPLAGSNSSDRLLTTVTGLAERVSMVRLGATSGRRFGWRTARSPNSLVTPAGA